MPSDQQVSQVSHYPVLSFDDAGGTVEGRTIAQWSQDWLKWFYHSPASSSPGDLAANAGTDNTGRMFFLVGGNWPTNGDPIPTINVPAGKPILAPLINLWDFEAAGIPQTIDQFAPARGTFADEARFIAGLAQNAIYDAHVTVTRVGDTQPLIDEHWPSTNSPVNTGVFNLGQPQSGDVLSSILEGANVDDPSSFTNIPVDEVGMWAAIRLAPGDYRMNFGGAMHALVDPASTTGTPFFSSGVGNGDFIFNTTDILHVG